MTTVIEPFSLKLNAPRANRITPGDFEGSAPKPSPPCDHTPPRRRWLFRTQKLLPQRNGPSSGASWGRFTAIMPMGLEHRHSAQLPRMPPVPPYNILCFRRPGAALAGYECAPGRGSLLTCRYIDDRFSELVGVLGCLGGFSVICLPQSSACQRSLVEVRPTIPVCTLVGSVGLCVRLGLSGASNP